MSVRHKATQCLGKQLPDKPHSRPCNSTSRWPGRPHLRWHEERESSKLIQTGSSPASVATVVSERMYRSRETVKAWLESSPTSVLEDLDDESASPSSLDSFASSPVGSVEHLSYTTRFPNPASRTNPPGHTRSRTISPPRRANRNSVDLSRIDPAHYNSGSFLVLAFKNAQYRGTSVPPAFQYTSEAVGEEHVQCLSIDEYGSPRSEFSLTSEWQNMLAAGTAAGMSTRDSSGNNSEFETPCEVLNISDLDLDSDVSDPRSNPQVVRLPHRRTRSMELPDTHECFASGESKDLLVEDKSTCAPAKLGQKQTDADTIHEQGLVRRLSRRNSRSFTSIREVFGEVDKRKVKSTTAALEEVERAKLISRYEREEKELKSWKDYQRERAISNMKQAELKLDAKHTHLMEKMENDMAMARRKADDKKATAEAKRAEKEVVVMEAKLIKRTGKIPRGCLFLV
ncbi:hypothetical protein KC19_1G172800 [Ceratodon purpureus]|uniref:Remorin C-terminal domain-containing protein n=1 Tax=Ceratodon purpureus TaxID=3225 RepID=A0A8T0J646_CERPU|nr:hypothetical protein KC19_1G172800 [Ceratodon purpureus]